MISRGWTDEDVARVENPAVKGVQPNESPKPKGRIPKPEMNSTERRYAQYLDLQKAVGEILWYGFETVTIKLGPDCRFTPDFLVMLSDGSLSFHDTKGSKAIKTGKRSGQTQPYVEEDARVKTCVLAANFVIPISFVWQRQDGEWEKREL
jgi:hypothetical protein